jgi:hypothetical protein
VNLENVTREDWLVGGLALLLAITLLFFPWFSISVSIGAFSTSVSSSATGSPDGWLGVLALLAAILIVADIAIERLSPQTQLPAIRGSRTSTRFILAVVAAVCVALKFLFHIHFSLFGWGFYLTVILAAALLYLTIQARAGRPAFAPRSGPPAS